MWCLYHNLKYSSTLRQLSAPLTHDDVRRGRDIQFLERMSNSLFLQLHHIDNETTDQVEHFKYPGQMDVRMEKSTLTPQHIDKNK